MKFRIPTHEELSTFTADCPECEYCCIIGLCCPVERQYLALIAFFVRTTGSSISECAVYAQSIVEAKIAMSHKS